MPHSCHEEMQQSQLMVVDLTVRGHRDLCQPQGIDQNHVDWQNPRGTAPLRASMAHDDVNLHTICAATATSCMSKSVCADEGNECPLTPVGASGRGQVCSLRHKNHRDVLLIRCGLRHFLILPGTICLRLLRARTWRRLFMQGPIPRVRWSQYGHQWRVKTERYVLSAARNHLRSC